MCPLKDKLGEQHMPERLIVVATSNDASTLDEALLQRFETCCPGGFKLPLICRRSIAWQNRYYIMNEHARKARKNLNRRRYLEIDKSHESHHILLVKK